MIRRFWYWNFMVEANSPNKKSQKKRRLMFLLCEKIL